MINGGLIAATDEMCCGTKSFRTWTAPDSERRFAEHSEGIAVAAVG